MAVVEVDETQWASATRVVGTVEKMLANPQTRRAILEAQKVLNPNLSIPEIDAPAAGMARIAQLEAALEAQRQAFEDDKKGRAEEKRRQTLEEKWDAGRNRLKRAGWSDEGISKVEKFMEERLVADHEVAAAAFERLNPEPAAVVTSSPNRFDLFATKNSGASDEASKMLLAGNDEGFLANMIPQTLAELRGGR